MEEIAQSNTWSAPELTETRITLLGATLGAFTYGLATCLFVQIVHLRVAYSRSKLRSFEPSGHIQNIILMMYTSVMFALLSVSFGYNNYLL